MEKLLFPKKSYYLTQGYGNDSYSHKGVKALDVSAAGGGSKEIYAPFTGTVKKVYTAPGDAYTIWIVSDKKVLCADGKEHYVVAMFGHPFEIAYYKVGQKVKQGEHIMNDGTTGIGTGAHLHFEIAIYDNLRDVKTGFISTNAGTYGLANSVNPCDYMLMPDDTKILNEKYLNRVYRFKKASELSIKPVSSYTTGTYKALGNMRVRTGPGIKYSQKQVKDLSADGKRHATSSNLYSPAYYKAGTLFDALEIIKNSDTDIWARGYSGYINIVNGNEVNCEKI